MPRKYAKRTRHVVMAHQSGGLALAPLAASAVPLLRQTKVLSKGSRALGRANIPIVSDIARFGTPIISSLGFGAPPPRRTYRRRR